MPRLDTLPPALRREYTLMHDARAVRDIAWFNCGGDVEDFGVFSWVLAILHPDPDSGVATIPDGYIKAETGELMMPPRVEAIVLKKGRWEIIAQSKELPRSTGAYSWSEPLEQRKRVLTPEDYYSPFAYGGTITCRPTPEAQSIEQFGPVYLIFPDWADFVQPAFDIFWRVDDLTSDSAGDPATLMNFVSDENGIISTVAFRKLIATGAMVPETASNQLARVQDRRRSILTYLMTTRANQNGTTGLVQAVVDRVRVARQPEEVSQLTLGAFAAALFESNQPDVGAGSRTIMIAARDWLHRRAAPPEHDATLSLMFQKMGI